MLEHIDVPMMTQISSSLCREFGLEFPVLKSSLGKRLKNMIMKKWLPEKQFEYKINLQQHLLEVATNCDDSLDSRWNKITGAIHKIAEETFGKASKKQPNDWFDKECREATEVKNKAYVNMQQWNYTRASTNKYREARRKEKWVHEGKKKQYENEQVERLEELGQQYQIRKFYRDINKLRKDFKPRLTVCKSKNRDIITEKGDSLNRWKDHFHEPLNSMEQDKGPSIMQGYKDTNGEDSAPTVEEVAIALQTLQNYKAPGTDNTRENEKVKAKYI